MKKFMPVVLVALMCLFFMNSFAGCKEEKLSPPAEETTYSQDKTPVPDLAPEEK